jgi:hypothetical protein
MLNPAIDLLICYPYLRPMRKFSLLIISLSFCFGALAQVNLKDSVVFAPLIDMSYSLKAPAADLADRFGLHSEVGIALMFKTRKNFLWGADFNYLFGNNVKDTRFADGFRDDRGFILANNGLYSEMGFSERGFTFSGKAEVIVPEQSPNKNSGLMFLGGIGMMQHKIKMEDRFNEVPLLSGDNYSVGYDRLSNGVMFTQFLGYRLLSNRRLINVFGGLEFTQAFTHNQRSVNYDTGLKETATRNDFTYGFRLGITIPLYKQLPQEYYYK